MIRNVTSSHHKKLNTDQNQGPRPKAQAQPKFWKFGDLEIQNFGVQKMEKYRFSKFKSVLPKMAARFGLVGKNHPGPIWGHPRQFFPWTGKIQKMPKFCLCSLVGQWALFTRGGPLLLSTRGGAIGIPFACLPDWRASRVLRSIPSRGWPNSLPCLGTALPQYPTCTASLLVAWK